MTTCPYTGGQVSSSLTPNLSRRTAQLLADSGAPLPRAAAARGTTDLDQRTDVRGLLVERGDRNEINVWHDESWFNNLGHYLILGNLRIDPRFATLSCWKTGTASAEDAIIVRHRMRRLAEEPALENHIFAGIDVADLRSALVINQRWEHISAELLTDHQRPRPDATSVAATKAAPSGTSASKPTKVQPAALGGAHPYTSRPARNEAGPLRNRGSSFFSENAPWILLLLVIIIVIVCLIFPARIREALGSLMLAASS
jgi:hypothetical protein